MNKIYVTKKETLDELELGSALTIEGLAEDSIPDFINWIKSYTPMKNEDVYVISGKMMNDSYGLTGKNRYQDDLTLVSVKLDSMENAMSIVYPRFGIGGRWFDDIVANNEYFERETANG